MNMNVKLFILAFAFNFTLINCQIGGKCNDNSSYTDPNLGTVNLDPENYCNPVNGRTKQLGNCCLPDPPNSTFPKFYIFLAGKSGNTTIDWRKKLPKNIESAVKNGKVVYLVHGFAEPVLNSKWIVPLIKTFNKTGHSVIVVDWTEGSYTSYGQATANVRTVGKTIGYSLNKWKLTSKAKLIGHSLGSHVVHEAGKYMNSTFNTKPKDCLGLDPAGPLFDGTYENNIRLNINSCELVQVIHSNSEIRPNNMGFLVNQQGTFHKSGHCDWWINCGNIQPNCREFTENEMLTEIGFHREPNGDELKLTDQTLFCSHHVSYGMYIISLRKCNFVGHPCYLCGKEGTTQCQFSPNQNVTFLECNVKKNANYYVETNSFPYCLNSQFHLF